VADPDTVVLVPGPVAGPSFGDLQHRLAAVRSEAAAVRDRAMQLRQALGEAIRGWRPGPGRLVLVPRPEYDQMVARLQTMPVIEQAKGIIMVQSRCTEAEAFQTLRQVSQRTNMPVRELAAQIVAKTAQVPPRGSGRAHAATRSREHAGRSVRAGAGCGETGP